MTLLSTEVLADNTLEEFRIEFNRLVKFLVSKTKL